MNKKQILSGALITGLLIAGTSFAATNNSTSNNTNTSNGTNLNQYTERGEGMGGKMMRGKGMGLEKGYNQLTDEEKTALKNMSTDKKKTFFEQKVVELKAKKEARENVIDKLLAGETLTSDEEVVRQEIIQERTKMKMRQAEMEQIRTIIQKQRAGETLTSDEQILLDNFNTNKPNFNEEKSNNNERKIRKGAFRDLDNTDSSTGTSN